MIKKFLFLLLLCPMFLFAQNKRPLNVKNNTPKVEQESGLKIDTIATIDKYKIITLKNDTTFVDTSLTIQKEYKFNYLRKDNFGLLPFANEGSTYNTLQYSLNNINPFPEFGFSGKHFNYMQVDDIKYYNVATPMTELYFKTVMEQGQMIDAFITLNTSERLNFAVGYRGLRSLGKYVNQLSSNGNLDLLQVITQKTNVIFLKHISPAKI